MTWHIWKEESVTPSTRTLDNVRGRIDSDGPHLITLGIRCVVADGTAGICGAYFRYENPNGQIQLMATGYASLVDITDAGGGIWYEPMRISIDKRHALGDGPLAEDPYGVYTLGLTLAGAGGAGTSKITYEAMLYTFDGNNSIIYHP